MPFIIACVFVVALGGWICYDHITAQFDWSKGGPVQVGDKGKDPKGQPTGKPAEQPQELSDKREKEPDATFIYHFQNREAPKGLGNYDATSGFVTVKCPLSQEAEMERECVAMDVPATQHLLHVVYMQVSSTDSSGAQLAGFVAALNSFSITKAGTGFWLENVGQISTVLSAMINQSFPTVNFRFKFHGDIVMTTVVPSVLKETSEISYQDTVVNNVLSTTSTTFRPIGTSVTLSFVPLKGGDFIAYDFESSSSSDNVTINTVETTGDVFLSWRTITLMNTLRLTDSDELDRLLWILPVGKVHKKLVTTDVVLLSEPDMKPPVTAIFPPPVKPSKVAHYRKALPL